MTEFIDPPQVFDQKISQAIKLHKASKKTIIYTGAGISTAAQIPDIRGDKGLETKPVPLICIAMSDQEMDCKFPTMSHRAITSLLEKNLFHFVITSNHDNLHQKAGTPSEKIVDLFGNVYVEK